MSDCFACDKSFQDCLELINKKELDCCQYCSHNQPRGYPIEPNQLEIIRDKTVKYCESEAELIAYDIIEDICRKKQYDFYNQIPIMTKDKTYEKYRLDFLIESDSKKLCIEIDGKFYHKNKLNDMIRDSVLKALGVKTVRFPAIIFFRNKINAYEQVLKSIEDVI